MFSRLLGAVCPRSTPLLRMVRPAPVAADFSKSRRCISVSPAMVADLGVLRSGANEGLRISPFGSRSKRVVLPKLYALRDSLSGRLLAGLGAEEDDLPDYRRGGRR